MASGDWSVWADKVEPLTPDELAKYDAVSVAGSRAERCLHLYELLSIVKMGDGSGALKFDAKELSKRYLGVLKAYRSHDERYERGWAVPTLRELMDRDPSPKAAAGAAKFSVELFREKEWPVIEENVKRAASACLAYQRRESGTGVLGQRKILNSTMLLFDVEYQGIRKALEHL